MNSFDDWREDAKTVPLLQAAQMAGAKLKRAGSEHVGPCPICGGRDRFSVNPAKGVWNCRGAEGGHDSISLIMHTMGYDFKKACELLTGTPPPDGRSGQIDPQAAQRAAERRKQAERYRQQQEQEEAHRAARKRHSAWDIWKQGITLKGTEAEAYGENRGIEGIGLIPSLRFNPSVYNEDIQRPVPAMIGCVIGPDKGFRGVWRVFLKEGGQKADVPQVKKGLGRPEGGSVWIATKEEALQPVWGICEGIETALSIRQLFGLPVFAALSTSGMIGFQVPPHVKHLVIYADGDIPTRMKNGGWNEPPGMHAARKLSARLKEENVSHRIERPPQDGDWNDVLKQSLEAGIV